jgi:hypothetical protein
MTASISSVNVNKAKEGQVVSITANAATDYVFSGWTTTTAGVTFADATSASTTFEMPASDVSINATFTSTTPPPTGRTAVIGDAALRAFLVAQGLATDTNDGNGTVVVPDDTITSIDMSTATTVASIDGLAAAFPALTTLNVSNTKIVDVNLTGFAELVTFTYRNASSRTSSVTSIDAHGLIKLTTINAQYSDKLETLDISGCKALTSVRVGSSGTADLVRTDAGVTSISFSLTSFRTYYDVLQTLKADGLTQVQSVIHPTGAAATKDIRIENISFQYCTALTSMTLAGADQTTAITIDITGTPLSADNTRITGLTGAVSLIQ